MKTPEEPEAMGPDEHYREAVDYLHTAANEPHVRDDLAQLAWLHFRAAEVGLALEAAEPEWEERGLTEETPRGQTVGTGKIMVGPAPNPFVRPPAIEWTDGFAQSWSKATEGIRRTVAGVTRAQNTATAAKLADPHGKNRCVAVHQAPGDKPGGVRCLLDEGHTGQHKADRDGSPVRWGPSDRMTPEQAAKARGGKDEPSPSPSSVLTGTHLLGVKLPDHVTFAWGGNGEVTLECGKHCAGPGCSSVMIADPIGGDVRIADFADRHEHPAAALRTSRMVDVKGLKRCISRNHAYGGVRCDIQDGHTCDHEAWSLDSTHRVAWE